MCPERFSVVGLILRGSVAEAERAIPGKGCELISALSAVGDVGLLTGLAAGVALAFVLYEARGAVLNSRLYRMWKEARNVY